MNSALTQAGYTYNVQASIWSRPGYIGIAYSDGDEVEQRIASIIESATDLAVLSDELVAHCTDWPSLYHLSGARANILRPFQTELAGDILEIGAGCGAITRYLGECGGTVLALEGTPRRAAIARARTRDLDNVTVASDNFNDFRCDRKFDVVTLIGVLEYANLFTNSENPTLSMLESVRSFLKPDGKLLIAIENQLGLKYFAGAPEDHVGIPMYGIENRYLNNQPKTFGRKELADLIHRGGFRSTEFLAPFPDYKLPVSIVTQRGFACNNFDAAALAVQSACRDPQLPAVMAFSPELVWPSISSNGLAMDLANSFLIVASPAEGQNLVPSDLLAWHFTTGRRRAFCKSAQFVELKENQIEVRYERLGQIASNLAGSTLLQNSIPDRDTYRQGTVLSQELLDIVTRDGWSTEEVSRCLSGWLSFIAARAEELGRPVDVADPSSMLPGSFFDYIPQNIIVRDSGGYDIIDAEWVSNEEIEVGYFVFRAFWALLHSVKRFGRPANKGIKTHSDFIFFNLSQLGFASSHDRFVKWIATEYSIQSEVLGRNLDPTGVADRISTEALSVTGLSQAVNECDQQLAATQQLLIGIQARLDDSIDLQNRLQLSLEVAQSEVQRIVASKSWRITRPFRIAVREVRKRVNLTYIAKVERSVKHRIARLPLPAPVRDHLRALYHRIRRAVRPARTSGPSLLAATSVRPEEQTTGLPDYIFWGVIDWHFRHQRPQHLAQAIAATGRRVFYVSAHLEDQNAPGFSIEKLDHTGRLFQIRLYVRGAPSIYDRAPDATALAQLKQSVGEMLDWANGRHVISIVQHSYWHVVAKLVPNSRMVYDCMDHHEGFGNNSSDILALEKQLLRDADLTIATSSWLAELITPRTTHCQIVRNAGDYQHFSAAPTTVFRDHEGRKVIGYIGAIAEWFDLELIEKIALRFGDCLVLLVGNDTTGASARLRHLANVKLTGEIPYKELPFYVHSFDVCLLPFRIIPLTLATNPVKVYEYLGTGKPVVATSLPETLQFGDLIEKATSHEEFLHAVERSLSADPTQGREARQRFAREQTWAHRGREIIAFTESPRDEPLVSVVVVTYNNLALTQTCLASLDTYSDYPAIEIIVVDNASGDGSPDFLRTWAQEGANRTLVLNAENRGFAAANNQGLSIAKGEYVILLNNDTHVTPGWIRTLVAHMRRDPTIGLIGPVTNNIGNEAKIEIGYTDMPQMLERSAAFTRRHLGVTFDLPTVAFFCVAIPRTVYEKIGPLDEAFGRGFFEDDDYCRRVEEIGLRIVCAEDVFIHHHLSASFNKLGSTERQKLFNQNKAYYESKWGEWKPHSYR